VFVTQLPSKAGISVWRIAWVMNNCRFMSDMCIYVLFKLLSIPFLLLSFRRVLNVICSFLGNSPASEF